MQLSLKACAVASGTIWAIAIGRAMLMALVWNFTAPYEVVRQFYWGWISQSWSGMGVGMVLGFINGAVAGLVFALVYNAVARATKRPE